MYVTMRKKKGSNLGPMIPFAASLGVTLDQTVDTVELDKYSHRHSR